MSFRATGKENALSLGKESCAKKPAFVAIPAAEIYANWIYRLPPFPGDRLRRSSGAKRRAKAGQRRGRKQAGKYVWEKTNARSACFLPRLCPAFALPGNSLCDIDQTGGDCLFYRPKPVRPPRSRGLRAPEKPALGLVFSEKRAGRPRKKSSGEERGARSARKLIQWINFSEGGPVGPGSRSSRTFPLQRLISRSYHGSQNANRISRQSAPCSFSRKSPFSARCDTGSRAGSTASSRAARTRSTDAPTA